MLSSWDINQKSQCNRVGETVAGIELSFFCHIQIGLATAITTIIIIKAVGTSFQIR